MVNVDSLRPFKSDRGLKMSLPKCAVSKPFHVRFVAEEVDRNSIVLYIMGGNHQLVAVLLLPNGSPGGYNEIAGLL